MDIISQLQEQVNTIAMLALNTFGTLQRDAPPVRLSPDYPEPPATNPSEETVNVAEQSKAMSAALVQAAKKITPQAWVVLACFWMPPTAARAATMIACSTRGCCQQQQRPLQ